MPGYKRERTQSAYEEKNVTEFVESCINLKPEISFESFDSSASMDTNVLILGTEEQIKANSAKIPVWDANIEFMFNNTSGSLRSTWNNAMRISVGVVSGAASRHNCATRPDAITGIVRSAVADGKNVDGLDIIVLSTEELAVASAIARAQLTFTAKKGAHDDAYMAQSVPIRVFFLNGLKSKAGSLEIVAKYIQLCQRLVDAPTNLLDTTSFAEIAVAYAEKLGCGFDVIKGEELRERGYGGLYCVGKGAEFPPHLVTLTYKPQGEMDPQDKIAFVGKGMVYDTGGLAIKTPATFMCGMKGDMGGAAATFGGFCAAVELGAKYEMSVTLCMADNAIGPRSLRNDDIIRMKSGLSIEVHNTDAEGRLVLGDGVYHASSQLSFTPTQIVNMATLTGAQGITTGQKHAGLYVNNAASEAATVAAGKKCGDVCFPMVYLPEYHGPQFESTCADYKNIMKQSNDAGSSCGGFFVEANLAKDYKGSFVHVDLAFPSKDPKGATGFGVALIVQLYANESFAQ